LSANTSDNERRNASFAQNLPRGVTLLLRVTALPLALRPNAWSVTVVLLLQGTNTTAQFDDVVLSSN
jgi:hypothetical protein